MIYEYTLCSIGDKILVLEISRLVRSTKQLCGIIEIVKEKGFASGMDSTTIDCSNGTLPLRQMPFVS